MKKIIISKFFTILLILIFGISINSSSFSGVFASSGVPQNISPNNFSQFIKSIGEDKKDLNKFISNKDVWKISLTIMGKNFKNDVGYFRKISDFGLVKKGINPNSNAKKYETIKFLFGAFGISTPFFNNQKMNFKDIESDNPVASKCLQLNICKGRSDKIFGKNSPITKGEFYTYLLKTSTFVYSKSAGNEERSFSQLNNSQKKIKILENIFETIKKSFYKKNNFTNDELIYGAAKGMADAVGDKYTKFFPPVKSKSFNESLNGNFEGIGAYIEKVENGIQIITPINGSPAKKAGLKSGDIVLEVDGKILKNFSLSEGVNFIKGPSGTSVKLKVSRGNNILYFSVKRGKIVIPSVEIVEKSSNILRIKINQFGQNTDKELFQILSDNSSFSKIIFDLRDNPGGYLDVAKKILSMFVESGKPIVKIKYPNFEVSNNSSATVGKFRNKKIAILTNGGSASASEIFAGTMQDYGLAKIFGEKTYGKGTVQSLVDFYDGSQFKLTIANWKTGKGRLIEGEGIHPNFKIIQDASSIGDEVLKGAENWIR